MHAHHRSALLPPILAVVVAACSREAAERQPSIEPDPQHAMAHAAAQTTTAPAMPEMPGMPGTTSTPGMASDAMAAHMQSMQLWMSWMSGTELKVVAADARPPDDAALVQAGQRLFSTRCTACHGEQGNGEGPQASKLSIPPRDFTAGVFKLRSTPSGELPRDEDLYRTISNGMHGTAMLPWAFLSEPERWALVAYVKSFSPRFAQRAAARVVEVPPVPDGAGLADAGRVLYATLKCNACHGSEGRGDGLSAAALLDRNGRRIVLRDLGEGRFKRGTALEDIYLTLRTGLDGSPMPSFEPAITPEQTWTLAAYMRQLSQRDALEAAATPMPPMGMGGMMGRGRGMGMGGGMGMGMAGMDAEEHLGMMINMQASMGMR